MSAVVAKSAAVIPHPESSSDSHNVHLSPCAHGHHYFFPCQKKQVNHRFWGAAAHRGGISSVAFSGNSLLRSHQMSEGREKVSDLSSQHFATPVCKLCAGRFKPFLQVKAAPPTTEAQQRKAGCVPQSGAKLSNKLPHLIPPNLCMD